MQQQSMLAPVSALYRPLPASVTQLVKYGTSNIKVMALKPVPVLILYC